MSKITEFPNKQLLEDIQNLEKRVEKTVTTGDDGGMNGRLGKLEGIVEQLSIRMNNVEGKLETLGTKIDRHLYFTIGGFTAMLGVMAKGFVWL